MSTLTIKRGDTLPVAASTLTDESGTPQAVPATATVKFLMRDAETREQVLSGAAEVADQAATPGRVLYRWAAGETDREGDYEAEWEVTYADGGVQTFPTREQDALHITFTADVRPGGPEAGGYCTRALARRRGASGTDEQVDAAILWATETVDRLTGQWWQSRTESLLVWLETDGSVRLPRHVQTITEVRVTATDVVLDPLRYRLLPAGMTGARVLAVTYPPLERTALTLTGTWGWSTTPEAIAEATARLAASFTGTGYEVNSEGDATAGLPPTAPALTPDDLSPITRALLAPHLRARHRVS